MPGRRFIHEGNLTKISVSGVEVNFYYYYYYYYYYLFYFLLLLILILLFKLLFKFLLIYFDYFTYIIIY